jgi:hypothetical protein
MEKEGEGWRKKKTKNFNIDECGVGAQTVPPPTEKRRDYICKFIGFIYL